MIIRRRLLKITPCVNVPSMSLLSITRIVYHIPPNAASPYEERLLALPQCMQENLWRRRNPKEEFKACLRQRGRNGEIETVPLAAEGQPTPLRERYALKKKLQEALLAAAANSAMGNSRLE